ncbi:MAG TPA: glycoside hydrolase family 6 protein, partial [Jatrophihabitans sp.]
MFRFARPRRFVLLISCVTGVVTALAATLAGTSVAHAATSSHILSGGPFAGRPLYVDPNTSAASAAAATTNTTTKTLLTKLAGVPQATWVVGGTASSAASVVSSRVSAAAGAGAVTEFVVYNIPHRDCSGGQSSGGAASASAYQSYVAAIAAALKGAHAIVVLEPDSLADLSCLTAAQQTERLSLLKQAVATLAGTGAQVYLDGGHSGWQSASTMANLLIKAGIVNARGFALDVSNFAPAAVEVIYGTAISSLVGWKRFVVDTSRDGTSPMVAGWCNPSGASLGILPGVATGNAVADAFLWLKHPGESDGVCGTSTSPAGQFDSTLALNLAHTAGW